MRICFHFLDLLGLWLRPRNSSRFDLLNIGVVLPRSNPVLLLPLEIFNGRLVEFQFVVVILIIAEGVDIAGNRWDGLVLVQVDEMLQNLRFAGGIGAEHLGTGFDTPMVAA